MISLPSRPSTPTRRASLPIRLLVVLLIALPVARLALAGPVILAVRQATGTPINVQVSHGAYLA